MTQPSIKSGYVRVSSLIAHLSNLNNINKNILRRKAAVGTFTHKKIDECLKGNISITCIKKQNEYLNSFAMMIKEKGINIKNILQTETRYYNDIFKITGQIDCILKFKGKMILVDWKTTTKIYKEAHSIQLCLYKYLASPYIKIDQCYIVRLDKTHYEIFRINEKKYFPKALDIIKNYYNL